MTRSSILQTIVILSLLCSCSIFGQDRKQWAIGAAMGTSTELALSYELKPQWQISFVISPITSFDPDKVSYDWSGVGVRYYFNESRTPILVGFSAGITNRQSHSLFVTLPIGVMHKITESWRVEIAGELFRKSNTRGTSDTGLGISIGSSLAF